MATVTETQRSSHSVRLSRLLAQRSVDRTAVIRNRGDVGALLVYMIYRGSGVFPLWVIWHGLSSSLGLTWSSWNLEDVLVSFL